MAEWIEPQPVEVPPALGEIAGGHPLVAEALARRGITSSERARAFLEPENYEPSAPGELPDLDKAVGILHTAIEAKARILVWGDFDVDGQTSTTLFVSSLESLGANVTFYIPLRAKESHGLHLPRLKHFIAEGIDLLLTCDTGITANEAVRFAREQGVKVVVTDHHDLPETLPEADAVVNPKRLPDKHPLATLSGVGVAYKLVEALAIESDHPELGETGLDLVALGMLADVAELRGDTRYLVQRGLAALRETNRLGLLELMQRAEIDRNVLTEVDVNFGLAPRLNALGRLADANRIVEFLTTEDKTRARIVANQLEGLNAQRQLLTRQIMQAALAQIERQPELLEPAAIVLSHPNWPGGVIGLVAGRLAERYKKPAILLTGTDGAIARGSARSVDGVNITAAIAQTKDIIGNFGGHPMAAGLSLPTDTIPAFRRALSRAVSEQIRDRPLVDTQTIDAYLDWGQIDLGLFESLERLAPFGAGNPTLKFVSKNLTLQNVQSIGKTGEHLRILVSDDDEEARLVFFWGGAGWSLPRGRFDLLYTARVSTFRGERQVQIEWVDARALEAEPIEVATGELPFTVVDHRDVADPHTELTKIYSETDAVVWAEGEELGQVKGRDRTELSEGEIFIIWTTPPARSELLKALEAVNPTHLHLFARNPPTDRMNTFLTRLAGAAKFAMKTPGKDVSLEKLGGVTAQTTTAVRLGLAWLEAKGEISVEDVDEGVVQIARSNGKNDLLATTELVAEELRYLLAESRAYRELVERGAADKVLSRVSGDI